MCTGAGTLPRTGAEWQCALATDELEAADEAGKLADRYN